MVVEVLTRMLMAMTVTATMAACTPSRSNEVVPTMTPGQLSETVKAAMGGRDLRVREETPCFGNGLGISYDFSLRKGNVLKDTRYQGWGVFVEGNFQNNKCYVYLVDLELR
jgi:hypothetical protein